MSIPDAAGALLQRIDAGVASARIASSSPSESTAGNTAQPRFTAATAYDQQQDRTTATAELAARQTAAAATVAQAAADAATVQQEQLARYRQALAADDEAAAHEARNEMWEVLAALFSRTMELAAAWNDFAARSVDPAAADRSAP